jgi:DNA-directed RNA polymerase subunit RPC12/RpoP
MQRKPAALLTYHCKHCGAIVALIAPGAVIYDTRFQCGQCSAMVLIIKPVDRSRVEVYTKEEQTAPA